MNLDSCRSLLERVTQKIKDANDIGATNAIVSTLDLVWVLHMAMAALRSAENHRRGAAALDKLIGDYRRDEVVNEVDEKLLEHLFDTEERDTEPPTQELTHDQEMLREMHSMVASLCQKLGDNVLEVPCDLWRLKDHIDLMVEQRKLLATAFMELMGSIGILGDADLCRRMRVVEPTAQAVLGPTTKEETPRADPN